MPIKAVIFDLGGVLIDWNPRYVFHDHYFDSEEKRNYFFDRVCTAEWNENQDAGYPLGQATAEKINEFPDWEQAILDFYGRWPDMLGNAIEETVSIFQELRHRNELKLYALTNWSAETFPIALDRFDFLHGFDGRVVSGEEKTRKPFPEFYKILLDRYELKPNETVFIDDSMRNVLAARAMGIYGIHFESAEQLRRDLQQLNLL